MKRLTVLFLALLMLCGGCAKAPTVKVGVLEPLSGVYAAGGQLEYQGILEGYEEQAQVGDIRIELVPVDNASSEEGARTAAKQLVDAGVSVVIGSWGSPLSAAAGEVFAKYNIPAVSTTARVYDNDSYFSISNPEDQQGRALAALAAEQGWDRVAILYDEQDAYGIAVRNAFIEAAGEAVICAEGVYPADCEDFTAYVAAMKQEQADALLVPSAADDVVSLTELPVMGGDVSASEQVYHPVYAAEGAKAVGYDAYRTVLAAIERGGEFHDALTQVTLEGRTGLFSFTDRQAVRSVMNIQTPKGIEKTQFSVN